MDLVEIAPTIEGNLARLRRPIGELRAYREKVKKAALPYDAVLEEIGRQVATADKRFTVAFVGMYNSGKSTILNAILGLKGESRLSAEDSPDTAKSIRLTQRKNPDQPECLLRLRDGSSEACSWAEAKAYTSQVHLEQNPAAAAKAPAIVEVEYRLHHPLLASLDFLDLPGTGTSNWRTDTRLTHQRLKEAEQILWVASTGNPEPGRSDLADLQVLREVRANVVPLINVWSDEEEGISGLVSPAELEATLQQVAPELFAAGGKSIALYAREIDKARQAELPIREEWGLGELIHYLQGLGEGDLSRREKIRRIAGAIRAHLRRLAELFHDEKKFLAEQDDLLKAAGDRLEALTSQRLDLAESLRPRLVDLAAVAAHQVMTKLVAAADSFIDDELSWTNWNLLAEAFSKNEAATAARLKRRFEIDFLGLDRRPNFIELIHRDFLEGAEQVIAAAWGRLLRQVAGDPGRYGLASPIRGNFLDNALGKIRGALLQKGFLGLLAGVLGVLLFIPGGQLVELAGIFGLVVVQAFHDPLKSHRDNAKLRARLQLGDNELEVKHSFADSAMAIHRDLDRQFGEQLAELGAGQEASGEEHHMAHNALEALSYEIDAFSQDMTAFQTGGER